MESKAPYRYLVVFLIFLLALFLLYKLLEPVIVVFLASILITYISYPLYKWLRNIVKIDWISRLLVILVIILVLVIPMVYLVVEIRSQTLDFYNTMTSNVGNESVVGFRCANETSKTCIFIDRAEQFTSSQLAGINFNEYLGTALERLLGVTANYLFKIPQAFLGTTLSLFIIYFLLKDGNELYARITGWLPLRKKTLKELKSRFEKITHSIIFAQLFVAFAQGVIGMIGFYIFGVPNPIFWGVVMAFAALIPILGPTIIWLPAALLLMLGGYLVNNPVEIWLGVGLLAYGIIIISTVDNFLRVRILHKRAEIHPLIVLLGVVGGVNLFGIMGLFLGPIILALLITFFDNFKERVV